MAQGLNAVGAENGLVKRKALTTSKTVRGQEQWTTWSCNAMGAVGGVLVFFSQKAAYGTTDEAFVASLTACFCLTPTSHTSPSRG